MERKKNKSILASFRNNFIAGVVVLIPLGITVYLSIFIIKVSSKILPKEINPNNYLPYEIPGIEIFIAIFLITLIGWISLSFVGKKLLSLVNEVFKKIPILRTVYSAVTQMASTLTQSKGNKKRVVLVQYPKEGTWAVGFVTQENRGEISEKTKKDLVNVFLPTTPNPTSGFLLMYEKKDVIFLDISFEQASKFIVSAGTSNPEPEK
jgi:uncharacterized membrane protein|tara:strand:+ start:849 stop:1469 length:621 start_codon:yes stop_codon:yes gene_type:complete